MIRFLTAALLTTAVANAQTPPECTDRPLRSRILSEWSQALDQMRILDSDYAHVQRLPIQKRPSLGEVCLDTGALFHRVLSAVGKTGALPLPENTRSEVLEQISQARSLAVELTDLCMPESAHDWTARMPEMRPELQKLIRAQERLVQLLTVSEL